MIPSSILLRITKLFIILLAVVVFGVIYGIVTDDRVLILLSLALAVAGALKIGSIFLSLRNKEYETVEGTVSSFKYIPLRRCQEIVLTDNSGIEREIRVKGRPHVNVGSSYRLFLSHENPIRSYIPQAAVFLTPPRVLLGFEELPTDR